MVKINHYLKQVNPLHRKWWNIGNTVIVGMIIALIIAINLMPFEVAEAQPVDEAPIEIMGGTDWRSFPVKVGGTAKQNEMIAYAYTISGYSMPFVWTINGENSLWEHTRIHDSSANVVGVDMGFGVNSWFHPEIVNDPRFFGDRFWQMDRVYQMWAGGVTFYGFSKHGIIMEG